MPPYGSVLSSPVGSHPSGCNPESEQETDVASRSSKQINVVNENAVQCTSVPTPAKNAGGQEKSRSGAEQLSGSGSIAFTAIDRNELRRRRNNDAARRSRQARRAKEARNRARMTALERENSALRAQIDVLKGELEKMHLVILATNATRNALL